MVVSDVVGVIRCDKFVRYKVEVAKGHKMGCKVKVAIGSFYD